MEHSNFGVSGKKSLFSAKVGVGVGVKNLLHNFLGGIAFLLKKSHAWGGGQKKGKFALCN